MHNIVHFYFIVGDSRSFSAFFLRNAPTELMKHLGNGKKYPYAHDEPHGFAAGETYLPQGIPEPNWYQPRDRGFEIKIAEKNGFFV